MMPNALIYLLAISTGFIVGRLEIQVLHQITALLSECFIRIFKCLSLPIISLSILVTITSHMKYTRILSRAVVYTVMTTIAAATTASLVYLVISPQLLSNTGNITSTQEPSYFEHLTSLIPNNLLEPILNHQVMSLLLVTVAVGLASRTLEGEPRAVVTSLFAALHQIFMVITRVVLKIIPLGIFSFVAVLSKQLHYGTSSVYGVAQYLIVVVSANLIQGILVLPLWLICNGVSPIKLFRASIPALSLAFFSKSSAATLPVTIECTEKHSNPEIVRLVLPLCTTINMNGCAAFILSTVLFVGQSYGLLEINLWSICSLIVVSTIAAVGNAGVPMGCFFLSASLLATIGAPLNVLGVILPFYAVIDMIETSLNVWSDICVVAVLNKKA